MMYLLQIFSVDLYEGCRPEMHKGFSCRHIYTDSITETPVQTLATERVQWIQNSYNMCNLCNMIYSTYR